MTNKTIIVLGATGNLGHRIARELLQRGAAVRAIVRPATDPEKTKALQKMGVEVQAVALNSPDAIAKAMRGASCVVSALAGLREVIVDVQQRMVEGALQAGVPRFIPSDFCTDYTALVPGENRNFDLRREFKDYVDGAAIQATSIFNGAFADILQYNTPILNLKEKSIGYWGDKADWQLDFTTVDDTAAFTAAVALDDTAPRNLQIAGFQVSPNGIWQAVKVATGQEFKMQQLSGLEEFAQFIKKQRAQYPAGEKELYAKWQQGQYMYAMFSTQHTHLSNDRYENLYWTGSLDFIKTLFR